MTQGTAQPLAPLPLFTRLPRWCLVLLVAGSLALAGLSGAQALAAQGRGAGPGAGWPENGFTLAKQAARLATPALDAGGEGVPVADRAQVERLARRALLLEPTADRALSALALVDATAAPEQTLAIHRLVRQMTRRNEATTLVLAVAALEERRFAEALAELGQLLRIEPRVRVEALPLIVQLLREEAAIEPLAAMLRRERGWSDEFWRVAHEYRPGLANLVTLRRRMRDTPGAVEPRHNEFLLQALVADGQFALAETLAGELVPAFAAPAEGALRNSGFDAAPRARPFDWRLFPSATANVFHDVAGGTLTISAVPGPGGVVASQLVRLPAAGYALRIVPARAGAAGAELLRVEIACAADAASVRTFTGAQALAGVSFAPVAGCEYHFLTLHLASRESYPAGDIVLDAVVLRALDAAGAA